MSYFKLIRKGLKRGHVFHLDNGTPESLKRIRYSLKDCIYVDKKTVGEYRRDPPSGKSAEEIIGEQNNEIKEIKRILKSGKKEREEIEKYLKVIGINYDIMLDIDPYKINTNPLVYEYVRNVYNLKEYRWYLVTSLYMKIRYQTSKFISLFLRWFLAPRLGIYFQHKKVANYFRENPKKAYSEIDLYFKFFKYTQKTTFEKNTNTLYLILQELVSCKVVKCVVQEKYQYNPEGQLDFKIKTTLRFSAVAPMVIAFLSLLLYFLANRVQILLSFKILFSIFFRSTP
jgi:hypothetical protein